MNRVKALFDVASHNMTRIDGTMDYDRVTDTLIKLSNVLVETETDEFVWDLGESGYFTLGDLIVGAYWHYSDFHGGQNSKGYAALSALGQVFNPGMTDCESENMAYLVLNDMAES